LKVFTSMPRPVLVCACSFASRWATTLSSARACSGVRSSASRPRTHQVVLVAPRFRRGGQRQGQPGLRAVGELEAGRGDADHLVRLAVHEHGPSQHGRAPEAALPEGVAQDHLVALPRPPFVTREGAPGRGHDAERLEEARRDHRGLQPFGAAVGPQVDLQVVDREHLVDRATLGLRLPVEQVGRGHGIAVQAVEIVAAGLPDAHQPVLVRELEAAHDHRVQDVEDGPVGGQADRQRGGHQQAGPRALRQGAHGETDVAHDLGQLGPPSDGRARWR
jgi:hypothetical protein